MDTGRGSVLPRWSKGRQVTEKKSTKKKTTAKRTTKKTAKAATSATKAAKTTKAVRAAKSTKVAKATAKKATVARTAQVSKATRLRVKQVKSGIGHAFSMKRTLVALGLKHHQDEVVLPDNSAVRGMIRQVHHLVSVRSVEE